MRYYSPEELEAVTSEAFALRLDGNEKLKQGDLQGALMAYHQVLLKLKGKSHKYLTQGGHWHRKLNDDARATAKSRKPSLEPSFKTSPASIIAPALEGSTEAKSADPLDLKVKEAIKLTYLNSAVIHIKKKNWRRALECAQTVLKTDEKNPKAKFREAQARIGLGEINKGKQMLQELYKVTGDGAVAAALKELEESEKASAAKSNANWKGMFSKGKAPAEKSADSGPAAGKS
ncbi:hypothetical protein OIV83_000568 [Microbotryomycetes sp. JL201]|nr:hypothetical protein OIV83_000568 [Microbotryomycetes sp. JL201]